MPPSEFPPGDFATRRLPIETLEADWFLYRSHQRRYEPLFFSVGHPKNRFDDPSSRFGVCYCALSPEGTFAETFLRQRRGDFVDATELEYRSLASIKIIEALPMVACYGSGLSRLGATAAMSAGEMAKAQAWAQAIRDHPDEPAGLIYRVRHDNDQFGVAVFDRAQSSLEWADSQSWRYSPHLNAICARYDLIL